MDALIAYVLMGLSAPQVCKTWLAFVIDLDLKSTCSQYRFMNNLPVIVFPTALVFKFNGSVEDLKQVSTSHSMIWNILQLLLEPQLSLI